MVKPNLNSVEVHQVDGALVGAGSLWPSIYIVYTQVLRDQKIVVYKAVGTT